MTISEILQTITSTMVSEYRAILVGALAVGFGVYIVVQCWKFFAALVDYGTDPKRGTYPMARDEGPY